MKLLLPLFLLIATSAHGQMLQQIVNGGGLPLTLNPGWTFLQDLPIFNCAAGNQGCSGTNHIYPTTAGSVWILLSSTGNNTTISSVTSSSGTWLTCPASACHAFNTGNGGVDAVYNLTGSAGSTSFGTLNISAVATGFFYAEFVELLPPAGYTASLDTSGATTSTSCSTACPTVGLTLSGTDAVVQITNTPHLIALNGPFAYAATYVADGAGSGIALNTGTAAATTFGLDPCSPGPGCSGGSSWVGVVGLAFKSTAGTFSVPPPKFTLVNFATSYTLSGGKVASCTPTCNFTIPSTGAGHLLFLTGSNTSGVTITSISDGSNTWVTPSGANTCSHTDVGLDSIGCSYVLSSVSGVTTLTIAMSGNTSNLGVAVYEVSRSSGSFVLDAQGSTLNASNVNITGQSLASGCTGCSNSITGTNDVFFANVTQSGGPATLSLYGPPFIQKGNNSFGGGNTFWINYADTGILLNSTNANPTFATGTNNPSLVSSVAFK